MPASQVLRTVSLADIARVPETNLLKAPSGGSNAQVLRAFASKRQKMRAIHTVEPPHTSAEGQRSVVLGHRFMVRRSRDMALLLGISSAAVAASRSHADEDAPYNPPLRKERQ
ncbi:MAG: hypothetical protein ACXWMT_11025 [Candidatus Binataceae bacterium]